MDIRFFQTVLVLGKALLSGSGSGSGSFAKDIAEAKTLDLFKSKLQN